MCKATKAKFINRGKRSKRGGENNWLKNQQLGKVYHREKMVGRGRGCENNWPTD